MAHAGKARTDFSNPCSNMSKCLCLSTDRLGPQTPLLRPSGSTCWFPSLMNGGYLWYIELCHEYHKAILAPSKVGDGVVMLADAV
eukprot:scaffold142449_cov50-Attheya_sp.AAC.2